MAAGEPVSNELRDALNDAICKVDDLEKGGPEEPISYTREGFTRGYSISEICGLVKLYNDRMPDQSYDALKKVADDIRGETWNPGGIEKVPATPKDHSYKSGADFLETLYNARKAINESRQRNRTK